MKITIITLFPEMIRAITTESILGRAAEKGLVEITPLDLRQFGLGPRKQVDDTPYGGGAGMVLKVDVVVSAIRALKLKSKNKKLKIILLTPQGQTFTQRKAEELAGLVNDKCELVLVCGHYEGFDERIREYVDEEISIGDYILTGGELAAMIISDAVARLLPGVLGKDESSQDESFCLLGASGTEHSALLEYPHYTRPEVFEEKKVPEVLLSGNHARIKKWRQEQSVEKTKKRRPDLLNPANFKASTENRGDNKKKSAG